MWNGVGGSTNVYGALWPRYRPSDFRKGTEHGLAARLADRLRGPRPVLRARRPADRRQRPCRRPGHAAADDYPTPPLPLQAPSRRLAQAFDRLGWHWWPVPAGVISRDYDGRPACHGCGICNGCPRGSMSKFSLSVWPKALDAGVELRTYARVVRIEKGRDGPRHGRGLCRPQHRRAATSRRPRSSSWPPTASARRACCCLRQSRQQLGPGRPQPAAPHARRLRDVGRRAARRAHRLRRRR